MIVTKFVAIVILGYLLGSIPFGVLIGRQRAKVDIRQYGSGKMGATNVLRIAGRKAAVMVAALDLLKGALAVVFAGLIVGRDYLILGEFGMGSVLAQAIAALAAMAGHIWPIFAKFRGGRGVSTFFGGLTALCPLVAIFGGLITIIGARLTRFASLSSIAGAVGAYAILVPLTLMNTYRIELLAYALTGTVLIVVMHRDNIVRLLSGNERRLGEKAGKVIPSSSIDSLD